MTRSDMLWEWPKRCFSWPEEALLTNDEDFICVPREHTNTILLSLIDQQKPAVTISEIHHFYTNRSRNGNIW